MKDMIVKMGVVGDIYILFHINFYILNFLLIVQVNNVKVGDVISPFQISYF